MTVRLTGQMIRRRRTAVAGVALVALASGGCWNFPPEAVPYVSTPTAFRPVSGNDLGAAHAYVVGVAPERMREDTSAREMRASLRAETVPAAMLPGVVATPSAVATGEQSTANAFADKGAPPQDGGPRAGKVGLTTREAFPADSALREEAARAVDGVPTGDKTIAPTLSSDRPAAAQAPLPTTAAATAETADLNFDGYITLDEIIAMHRAGLAAETIRGRIHVSGYVLRATYTQLQHLRAFGVPDAALTDFRPAVVGSRPPLAETEMR